MYLGELSDDAADSTRGGGYKYRIARFGGSGFHQTDPGRHARHAEDAQVIRQRDRARAYLVQSTAIRDRIIFPAKHAADEVAFRERIVPAFDDLADDAGLQDFANLERRHVRFCIVHTSAHVRIHGHVKVADQQFALCKRRDFCVA